MPALNAVKHKVSSGVPYLDQLLDSLYIGDNVIWYDQAGSLASVFCLNLIKSSQALGKPLIYVTFDRSPRNLLEKLGPLADYPNLTILDCFTWGKGAGSEVFVSFYRDALNEWPGRVVKVDDPRVPDSFTDALYRAHSSFRGDVRFVFESLTGMQELWGGEENIVKFYAHSCPRLYELDTVAYWIIEKDAHSPRLRAQINQVAQVVVELSIKRGKTSLAVIKAEKRHLDDLEKCHSYWTRDLTIGFEEERSASGRLDLGSRVKDARALRGISQSELAKLIGVTPSTISQIESNLIYPSLPGLLKMAEVLSVPASSFLEEETQEHRRLVFPSYDAKEVKVGDRPEGRIVAKSLMSEAADAGVEPYLIEISPKEKLSSHFFVHKGEEIGYLISGRLRLDVDKTVYNLRAGDFVYLTTETPTQWRNPGPGVARLLWIKLK